MTRLSDRARIAGVEFRVLGPLSAFLEGEPRKLGGRRQRMVLAVLLSRPNEVVSQDELSEAVWSGSAPDSATQTLHSYISNLRKILGGCIDRSGDGYVVALEDNQLDSIRFESLVEVARSESATNPSESLAAAIEALGMWHGRAYGDLGSEPDLLNEAIRLDEARVATLELRIEADIALGNHAAVVQELEALTKEHPFREKLWGFLMVALYRSGRQADALRAYQDLRKFLGDELGIDPSSELQELEERILTHDPDLDVVVASMRVDRAARGYELREKLGETPYGVLYRGFQGSVGREVSVLRLDDAISSNPSFVRRFENEMRAVSELEHPHLVTIHDFWRDPDGAYLVAALPRGGTLREVLGDDPWNLSSVVRTADQLGSVLSYLHRNDFVHGALTLDSVLLDDESNAYISDLGLASLLPDSVRAVSPSADVSALASIAMALLTGDQTGSVARLGDLRPDLAELDDLFARALHPDPVNRFEKPEDLSRALRRAIGTDVVASVSEVPTSSRRNPYKGLRAFKESEAGDFHGRDSLVEDLIESLASRRLVAVVGPSGSGKSSLVRAGLLPAVRSGSIDGSQNWLIAEMFPGTHPFEELEAALIRVATDRPPGLIDELTSDERGLARAAKKIIGNDQDELVILIDQFEELFSLVSSETNRRLFLDSLAAAAGDERSRIRFVLTLRADFFDQPLQYPDFADVMNEGLVPLSPPSEEGLTRAIAQPARGVGVDLQPGLVTRIIDDVRDEPGGLPLMQYALTELFNKRENNTMTLAAYEESGGVAGALANRADEIFDDLSAEGKVAARNLFLRLVNVDEMADDTRRRVRQTELKGLSLDQTILDDVIQQFGAFRLLSFDRDAATRTPTVEVAHEALIREWDRLRTWIDDRREDLLTHRRIQVTARDWEDSEKDVSYLLRGSRLEQALIWQERTDIAISDHEMSFIEASIEQEKRDLAELAALEAKAARRRKAVIGVLAGGLVVAGALSIVAIDRAQSERIAAAKAFSQELSAGALLAVEEDPELAVLIALEAIHITDMIGIEPLPAAISALRTTQRELRLEMRIEGGLNAVSFSPQGDLIAMDSSSDQGTRTSLIKADSGDIVGLLQDPSGTDGRPSWYTFSAEGDVLAVTRDYVTTESYLASSDPEDRLHAAVDLYEAASGEFLRSLNGPPGFYTKATFSPSGLVAATWSDDSGLFAGLVWDGRTAQLVTSFTEPGLAWVAFVPGTETLLLAYDLTFDSDVGDTPGRVDLIDMGSAELLRSFELNSRPGRVEISPDGSMVAFGDNFDRQVEVRNIEDGSRVMHGPHQDPQALAWSSDGRLAVSGNDADVTIFEVEAQEETLRLTGHEASVWGLAFSPDNQHLVSTSVDGVARMWDVSAGGAGADRAIPIEGLASGFTMNRAGTELFLNISGGESRLLNAATGEEQVRFPIETGYPFYGWVDDDFGKVIGRNRDVAAVYDATGQEIYRFPDCHTPKAISPDGELVVVDTFTACVAGEPAYLFDLTTNSNVLDLGDAPVIFAMFSPEETETGVPYFVLVRGEVAETYEADTGRLIGSLASDDSVLTGFLVPFMDDTGRFLGLGANGSQPVVVDMEAVISGTSMADSIVFQKTASRANVPFIDVSSGGLVLTSGYDGLYRLWDLEKSEMLFEIRVDALEGPGVARFSRDESEIVYADQGHIMRFTPVDSRIVVDRARAALTRSLTDDECTQYLHTDGCEE